MTHGHSGAALAHMVIAELRGSGPRTGHADGLVLRVPSADEAGRYDLSVLDTEEHQRMSRLRQTADRVRYGFAHMALRLLLADRLNVLPASLRFTRDPCPCCNKPRGRPVLAQWPHRPLEFTLSHGGAHVAIGISEKPIGIDIEPIPQSGINTDELIPLLHPAEQAAITQSALPRAEAFTRIWVRKEAYLKGIGTGLTRPLHTDNLTTSPPGWDITDHHIDTHHYAALALNTASEVFSTRVIPIAR